MKGSVQVRWCGSGLLLGSQLLGLSRVVVLLEEELGVSVVFPSALSSWLLELLPVMATEVMLLHPVSDLKGLVELRISLPRI